MTILRNQVDFFKEFLSSPSAIGAIAPSSRFLARRMVEGLDLSNADAVVEYGPGTGVFTEYLLSILPVSCCFFAIEKNPCMAARFRRRFPDVRLFEDSAVRVASFCAELGVSKVDYIISGLPWASFPESLQDELLAGILAVLKPGGSFVTFAYLQGLLLSAGRRFRKKLQSCFQEVNCSPVVWLNLPPAFVYRCTGHRLEKMKQGT